MRASGALLLLAVALGGCAFDQAAFPGPTSPLPRSVASVPPAPAPAPPSPPVVKPAAPPAPPAARPSVAPPSPAPPVASPPRPSSPAPVPPPAPPRILSVGVEDETRMRRDAQTRIDDAERLIREIDRSKLPEQQERNFQTIESFLGKAREALIVQDLQRAFTLADKAYVLAAELSRTLSSR